MSAPPTILLLYDHFPPAWKAGGPIRSLEQLIHQTYNHFNFYVICSAFDQGDKKVLDNIQTDTWCEWKGMAKVYYSSKQPSLSFFKKTFQQINPDIVFLNGLYSFSYHIKPLMAALSYSSQNNSTQIILSPRGMLHPGALSQKRWKKWLYFLFFKLSGIPQKISWHATDEKEVHFIRQQFKRARIHIAGNFPQLFQPIPSPPKEKGTLIMGTIALISPMKNHFEILKSLQQIQQAITWHIYGPIKDNSYWHSCNHLIQELPLNIQVIYHGAIQPDEVEHALQKIQVFVMPSKSENFGHAIIEALSAGKPVITTHTTPFINLQHHQAGYTLSLNNLQAELQHAISFFADMDQEQLATYQQGAVDYANRFVNIEKVRKEYVGMFGKRGSS